MELEKLDPLLSFDGRMKRSIWWLLITPIIAIQVGVDFFRSSYPSDITFVLYYIVAVALLWPSWAVMAKRWHDRNKSGWWTLIFIIPVAGAIWAIVECGFVKGTTGENEYGSEPL